MRLRAGLVVLWRSPGTCQVGTDPRLAVVLAGLSDSEHTAWEAFNRRAHPARTGPTAIPTPVTRGLVVDTPEPDGAEGAYWDLAAALTGAVPDRSSAVVILRGADRLGCLIATLLAAAGVGTVLVDDAAPVRDEDTGVGSFRPSDVGMERALAAVTPLRAASPRVTVSAAAPLHPDLVIGVEDRVALPPRSAALVRADVPHLSVVRRELDIVVGPLVQPGRTACLRCLDLHRTDADPLWPTLATQLAVAGTPPASTTSLHVAAGLAAQQVLAFLDGRGSGQARTLEVDPLEIVPRVRAWEPHPRCGCLGIEHLSP